MEVDFTCYVNSNPVVLQVNSDLKWFKLLPLWKNVSEFTFLIIVGSFLNQKSRCILIAKETKRKNNKFVNLIKINLRLTQQIVIHYTVLLNKC